MEFHIDESVKPVVQPYRRVPIALEEKVEAKLDELLRLGIIEQVNKPCRWVSAMVIEPKGDGDIRICIDMRQANKAIRREVHPLPVIDEMLAKFSQCEFFSALDIEQAFHQVEIAEESRFISTFITSKGMFQYKRLMFGICCAPEKFQKILEGILAGCKGCVNFIDDIIVYGETKEIHDKNLDAVLKRLQRFNVKLNKQKCKIGVQELDILGFHISNRGVNITEQKLQAVRDLQEPKSVAELRGLLGYVNFMKKFVPHMSTVTAPLNQLLQVGNPFEWGVTQREAFHTLKDLLSRNQTLGFYNVKDRTEVIVDASPVGLGALLIQRNSDGEPRLICCSSKSLSACERRYAQTEKEALAIVWAVEKFHYYLYGKQFFVVTDHKPLEIIFGPSSRPCLRIERWVLRLASYDYKVIYKPGNTNIADPFSRLCQTLPSKESFDEISEAWIREIAELARPKAIVMDEFQRASKDDEWMQSVKNALHSGKWPAELRNIELIKNEICFTEDIMLRGTRVVVPTSLQERTLELAHLTHFGESGMKGLLRSKVWWPDIDRNIKNYVKGCRECLLNSLPNRPEPLKRRELPQAPWIDLATDYLGPFPTGEYLLIVVDYYSRYQEIELTTSTTARATVNMLRKIFGRNGYPATLTADNGPQFNSQELREYLEEVGVVLNTTTPYWPQQNGLVERMNRDVLKFIRCSNSQGSDWKSLLYEYNLMKNTALNDTTGKTPAELYFKRTLKNKLPSLQDLYNNGLDDEVRDRDRRVKDRGKLFADEDRSAKESNIQPGDLVYVKQLHKRNKLDSNFSPRIHKVVQKKGGDVVVEDCESKQQYRRSVAHLKKKPEEAPLKFQEEIIPMRPEEKGDEVGSETCEEGGPETCGQGDLDETGSGDVPDIGDERGHHEESLVSPSPKRMEEDRKITRVNRKRGVSSDGAGQMDIAEPFKRARRENVQRPVRYRD